MNNQLNQDADHPRDDPELEAYHDMKRELAEFDEESHRIGENGRWVGIDNVVVERTSVPREPREFGDNDPSDPFNNWEVEL